MTKNRRSLFYCSCCCEYSTPGVCKTLRQALRGLRNGRARVLPVLTRSARQPLLAGQTSHPAIYQSPGATSSTSRQAASESLFPSVFSVPFSQGGQRRACHLTDFMQELCQEGKGLKLPLAALGYGLPAGVTTSMAVGIFVATLALIMLRPKQLNEALAALAGGIAMIAAGIVSPWQALQTLLGDWNIFLFFLGMLTKKRKM